MGSQRKNNQGQSQDAFMNERWLRQALEKQEARLKRMAEIIWNKKNTLSHFVLHKAEI